MSAHPPTELTCQQLVELVTDYLEGKLSPVERARFEQHLLWCPPCHAYLDQLRGQLRAAGRLSERSIDDSTKDDLLRAFRGWKKTAGGAQ